MIMKFGTKLDSDELYCVTKQTAIYFLSVPLFVHFSFSPTKISFIYFSAPIQASVFKLCVHLQVDYVYCVTKHEPHIDYQSPLFVHFSFSQMKFLSQISHLLFEPVFSNFLYTLTLSLPTRRL